MTPTRAQRAWTFWLALPGVIRIAAVLVVLFAAWLALPARAAQEMIARAVSGGDSVRLWHKPCALTAHPLFPQGIPAQFEAASAVIGGQTFTGCWLLVPSGVVILIYEDGEVGEIPAAAFRPDGA